MIKVPINDCILCEHHMCVLGSTFRKHKDGNGWVVWFICEAMKKEYNLYRSNNLINFYIDCENEDVLNEKRH